MSSWEEIRRGGRHYMARRDPYGVFTDFVPYHEYRKLRARKRELRRLVDDGESVHKALRLMGGDLSALLPIPGIADLARWLLSE